MLITLKNTDLTNVLARISNLFRLNVCSKTNTLHNNIWIEYKLFKI